MNLNFLKSVAESGALIDLPLEYEESKELIKSFSAKQAFFSSHEIKTLEEITNLMETFSYHLKWSPEVSDVKDLYRFDALPRERVSFLPRSKKGFAEYKWYRLLRSNKVEFYRYGVTENLDQPLYIEAYEFKRENVGAVIGEDTCLSWSPFTHRETFKKKYGAHYLNVSCARKGFNDEFIRFLKSKGLRYLSVTSPLKKEAGQKVDLDSCNTLDLRKGMGLSTDQISIDCWVSEIKSKGFKKILIWGSGAMGQEFKDRLKELATIMSSRTSDRSTLVETSDLETSDLETRDSRFRDSRFRDFRF